MSDSAKEALAKLDVSRETIRRLEVFDALLRKWTPRINLVSRNSVEHLWNRHIVDSVQVFRCVQPVGHWVDLGSGGGFPGLVIAIMAADECPNMTVTLIESDQRKSAFLRTVARETGVACKVIAQRIESVERQNGDILSARALADLSGLLDYAEPHLKKDGTALFPKGVTWKKEIAAARQKWIFEVDPLTSMTESGSVILKIKGVSRA